MFREAKGDLIGLITNDNHINYEWISDKARIVFSATQKGDALSCHVASDKKGLRYLKEVINSFCLWAFSQFKWCKMIIAVIVKDSVVRVVKKCGFLHIWSDDEKKVYARVR